MAATTYPMCLDAAIHVKFIGLPQPYPVGLDDKLQLYFQSSRKSGGGDIENMYIYTQDDDPFAVIIFDKPETAHNVLARRNHAFVINNQKIELLVEAATWASGIEEVRTGESGPEPGNSPPPLLMSSAHSEDIYGSEPASDILPSAEYRDNDHHQQPLDLHQRDRPSDQQVNVRQECEKHQEQEPRLTSTVPDVDSPLNTSTIPDVDSPLNATSDHLVNEGSKPQQLLEVFFEKLSLDTVLMYFESKRHSGGGAIANHELLQLGNVLIIFEQAGVAEHVGTRRHQLEGQTLDVSLIEETSPGPNIIEVSGFASKIGVETLEMYFESKRRSGGGDIMECSMNEDRSKFTIKFAEAEVVEKVIHRVHEIENTRLTVKRPGKVRYRRQGKRLSRIGVDFAIPPSEDVHILVCFHKKMSLDMVLMYFESKKHSGGGDISNHELLQPGNLVITFQKPGEHVCTKQHKLEGQTLNVSVIEETGPAPNTIEVSGFASKIGEETLEMYFESKRRSGGGDITESSMNEDRSKFTITFANEGVVDRILKRDHELNGTSLNVHRPQKVWQHKHHVDKSVVEVHGVQRNTSTDLLQMYFESPRSGGDGNEVKVMYHENTNVWTVKFDNPEIADRVLEKSHRLNKKDIKVSRPQPKSIVSGKCTTTNTDGKQEDKEIVPLEVEDAKSSISEELLRTYFESPEKSGGGPIDLMQKNQKVIGSWTIHFHDPGVAQKVAGQKLHELSGSRLKVRLGKKRARRPLLDRCLLISGLPKNLNEEIFHLYLEKVTSKKAPIIKFGRDPSKAMVIYTDPIQDIDDVIARIEDQKLQNTKIHAKKVFEVDTIIVKNLDKSSTEEMLKLYFENHDRSGGGKINDMQLDKKRLEVTIQFENYTVVKSVFKKKHQLQKKELEVRPYYDDIGEFMSDGCRWKPDPVSMHADPYLLTFALMTQTCNDNFSTAGIQIEFNPNYPDILTLHAVEGDALELCSITDWEDYAESNFKRFFSDQFELKTLDIGDECFEEFQKYFENNEKTQGVKLILDDSSPSLMILGLKDAVETVWDQLSHKLHTMKDEIKRRKSIITQTKTYKPIKIKQIHLLEFEEAAMSNHGVKVMVDDHSNTVSFEGLPDDIKNADLGLYKELENLTEVSFPCDAEICKFLTDFYDEIIRVLKGNNLHFAYEIEGSRVKIYSTTNQDGKAAKSSIEGMIKHHKYPLPGDKMKVMKSSDGKQLLDGLKSHGYITVEIVDQEEAASCIMVTGFDMAVKKVVSQIDDFVHTNQILEKKKSLERGMVRLFEKHHSEELAAIESALNTYFVKLKPIDGKSCILIRGNRSGIDKAMESIIVLESKVQTGKHLVSQPGMASFFKEDKGRRALESVENHCKCIIEVDGSYISAAPMQISLRHRLQRGIELIVCKADMTQMKVDVIVNAANDKLQHVGGLAKAIVDAGGREIQEESDKIMAGRKALVPGEVIVTDAGKLPCKKIIHIVGPRYTSSQSKMKLKRLLMIAVIGAYEEAERYGFTSIGMPAISSGVYSYPLKPCTQAILEATEEYFGENPRSKIEQVYFLSVDMKVCKEFESSMETVFKVVRDENNVVGLDSNYSDDSNDSDDFDDLTGAAAMQTSSRSGLKIKNDVVTTREGFDISLIKGKIEDSKAFENEIKDLKFPTNKDEKKLKKRLKPKQTQDAVDHSKKDLVKSWVGRGETTDDSPITTTLTLKILALNDEDKIQAAKGRIQSIISDETTEKTIHNEVFSRFGKGNFMKKLKEIGGKHEVVVITTNIRSNTVELHGRSANVVEAQDDVFGLIIKFKDEERERTENELILKDVKWYYAGDVNEMEEFDDEIVLLLEKAYKKKERKVKYDAANNHTYEVDLKSMKEKDLKSKRTIAVTRRDLNAGQNLTPIWPLMTANEKLKVADLRQGQEYQDIEQQFTSSLAGQFALQSIAKVVVITTNIRSNTVELHGRSANVVEAQDDVFGLISKFKDEEREQTENELILKDVKWYYAGDVNEMEEFDDEIVLLLEKAYKKKERKVKYDAANNHTYEVDLKSMKEKDLKSKRTIAVTRRDLNAGQNLLPNWSPMTANEKLKVVDLQGQEYRDIEQQFTSSSFALQSIVKTIHDEVDHSEKVNKDLELISVKLNGNWMKFGEHFGFQLEELSEIRRKFSQETDASLEMLKRWRAWKKDTEGFTATIDALKNYDGKEIPAEILARGPDAWNIFKAAREEGDKDFNLFRLNVIGQENVGKTCLIDSILGNEFNERHDITDAIAVTRSCSMHDETDPTIWQQDEVCDKDEMKGKYENALVEKIVEDLQQQSNHNVKKAPTNKVLLQEESHSDDVILDLPLQKEPKHDKRQEPHEEVLLQEQSHSDDVIQQKEPKHDKRQELHEEVLLQEQSHSDDVIQQKEPKHDKRQEPHKEVLLQEQSHSDDVILDLPQQKEPKHDKRQEPHKEVLLQEPSHSDDVILDLPQQKEPKHDKRQELHEEVLVNKQISTPTNRAKKQHLSRIETEYPQKIRKTNVEVLTVSPIRQPWKGKQQMARFQTEMDEAIAEKVKNALKKGDARSLNTDDNSIRIWDFGGQPIYHTILRFFLTPEGLFIIVFKLTDDLNAFTIIEDSNGKTHKYYMTNLEHLLYWIRSSYTYSSKSKRDYVLRLDLPACIVVGTHRNALADTEEERERLVKKQFDLIRNAIKGKLYESHVYPTFFDVENQLGSSDKNIGKMKEVILKIKNRMKRTIPLKWFEFLIKIQELSAENLTLPLEEVKSKAKECGITDEKTIDLAIAYFSDVGEIMHHPMEEALRDTVVLQPMQLVDYVKTVFTVIKPELRDATLQDEWRDLEKGVLRKSLLKHLWKNFQVFSDDKNEKMLNFFIALMKKFGLICQRKTPAGHGSDDSIFYAFSHIQPDLETRVMKDDQGYDKVSIFHDFCGYLPDYVFQHVVTRFMEEFLVENAANPELAYEHVELDVDAHHRVSLAVATIKHRRMFKTMILRRQMSDATNVTEPEPETCKKVLTFLQSVFDALCKTSKRGIQYKTCVPCGCSNNFQHMQIIDDFNEDVIPCGPNLWSITRYRQIFGDSSEATTTTSHTDQRPLKDTALLGICDALDTDWKRLAICLGLTKRDLDVIESDNIQIGIKDAMMAMLVKWRDMQPSDTNQIHDMNAALKQAGYVQIAEELTGNTSNSGVLHDNDLLSVSDGLGTNWVWFGIWLGFKWNEIQLLKSEHHNSGPNTCMDMLTTWKKRQTCEINQVDVMCKLLEQHGFLAVADQLRRHVHSEGFLNDADFGLISKNICADWDKVAVELGIEWNSVKAFRKECCGREFSASMNMLTMWRTRQSSNINQLDVMCKVLSDPAVGFNDVAEQLRKKYAA